MGVSAKVEFLIRVSLSNARNDLDLAFSTGTDTDFIKLKI